MSTAWDDARALTIEAAVAWRTPPDARTLRQKVALSSAFGFSTFAGWTIMRLISTIILTRLLAPEIYGVFALILSLQFVFIMFTDLGVRALILSREDAPSQSFIASCFTVNVARGALLAVLFLALAGALAALRPEDGWASESAYANESLPAALAVMSLVFLAQSAVSLNVIAYEREMRFGRVFVLNMISSLSALVVMIVLAVELRSIWALVMGQVAHQAIQMLLSYAMFHGFSMRIAARREDLKVIFKRGRWILGRSMAMSFTRSADRILFSFFLTDALFGLYYIAFQVSQVVVGLAVWLQNMMGIQVFTELLAPETRSRFVERYYKFRAIFDVAIMLGCGMIAALGPLLVETVYDERYAAAGLYLQILALALPFEGPGVLRDAFQSQRQFHVTTIVAWIRAATIWIGLAIALAVFDSFLGALAVIALHRAPEIIALLWFGKRRGWIDYVREIRFAPLILVGAGLGLALDYLFRSMV